MRASFFPLAVALTAVLAACGEDDRASGPTPTPTSTATATPTATSSSTPTATATPTPRGVTALFALAPLDVANPFPSDRQRDGEGRLLISQPAIENFLPDDPRYNGARAYLARAASDLAQLDGFSTFGPIRIALDGAAALDAELDPAGIFLLRLDPPFERVPVRVRATTPALTGDFALEISPQVPLLPATSYAFAVTRAVRGADGRPLEASTAFQSALCDGIEDAFYAAWRQRLAPVRDHLRGTDGVECDDLVMLDSLTTQTTMDDLIAIRELFDGGALPIGEPDFESTAIPGLPTGVFAAGTPEFEAALGSLLAVGGGPDGDALSAIAIGTFRSFDFRGPNRAFAADRVAGSVTPPANDLAFYIAFPKEPPPPEGYPVVVYGHGLSRSGADAISTATSFTDLPMVWAGISAVSHGRRGNFLGFFNLNNVLATRDNFRQTVADFLQFQRMLRHSTDPTFASFDRSRFHYYGISLGGIIGALYLGVESDIDVAMLSVPGGGLPNILAGSDFIGNLLEPLISFAMAVQTTDPLFPVILERFVQLAQWVLDPGDPINSARYLLGPETLPGASPKQLLMHMGITDAIVPNDTSEDLVRAAGLADLRAAGECFSPQGCSGVWRFDMTAYDLPSDCGHLLSFVLPEAHRQSIRYLFSNGTEVEDASPRLTPAERPACPDLGLGGL